LRPAESVGSGAKLVRSEASDHRHAELLAVIDLHVAAHRRQPLRSFPRRLNTSRPRRLTTVILSLPSPTPELRLVRQLLPLLVLPSRLVNKRESELSIMSRRKRRRERERRLLATDGRQRDWIIAVLLIGRMIIVIVWYTDNQVIDEIFHKWDAFTMYSSRSGVSNLSAKLWQ
jgi:hypothetical protein